MTAATVEHEEAAGKPGFFGSLTYLLMNFPLGIFAFVSLVTLTAVGAGTVIIWVGLPVLAALILGCRGAARLERARLYALLDTYVAMPYRPLPEGGQKDRWKARLRDSATWRDMGYLLLLFPIGIAQFVLLTVFWATSLSLAALPIYFRFLPGGVFHFPSTEWSWFSVDTTFEALPCAALGVLFVALSVALTKAMAGVHARFARALLGPSHGTLRYYARGDIESDEPQRTGAVAGS